MATTREKVLTVTEAEEVTGVHYTIRHTGKMEGMQSLSTSCLCNENCKIRSGCKNLVCAHCYAQRQMKMYKNLNACLERNTEILTGRVLEEAEIPVINASFFRFESFGDLINATQVINYFNICKRNKYVKFALWTKNPWIIEDAIESGAKKPGNLQIVYSSPCLNEITEPAYSFIDKVFTVFDKDYIKEHNIEINCGAKSCLICHKCYTKSKTRYINEKLK